MDNDLGFVFWLGQSLDNAGYHALPAKSLSDAFVLLGQINLEIDLLIVGLSLEGAGAFADALRRFQGHLKVITVVGEWEEPSSAFPGADASERRPVKLGDVSRTQWVRMIQRVFESPNNTISATG